MSNLACSSSAKPTLPHRHQLHRRLVAAGDHYLLAGLCTSDEVGKLGLRLMHFDRAIVRL
jgi:hypothetical protein